MERLDKSIHHGYVMAGWGVCAGSALVMAAGGIYGKHSLVRASGLVFLLGLMGLGGSFGYYQSGLYKESYRLVARRANAIYVRLITGNDRHASKVLSALSGKNGEDVT
jgi:hypothetical protein